MNVAFVNVLLSIYLLGIIVHAFISTCSHVVHVSSPSLAMDVGGNGVDSHGSHAPLCCPHKVSMSNISNGFDGTIQHSLGFATPSGALDGHIPRFGHACGCLNLT